MSRILDPTNDWDYAQILMHDAKCEVIKKKGKESLIANGTAFYGKLTAPEGKEKHLRHGEMAFFKNNRDDFCSIGAIESIDARDVINKIIVQTRNGSSYAIEQVDTGKHCRKMSLMYLRRGYLGYDDYMADGFFDGGKSSKFCIDNDIHFKKCTREIILYNANIDKKLAEQLEFAEKLVNPIDDIRTKIKLLAVYVVQTMGGRASKYDSPRIFVAQFNKDIKKISSPNKYGLPVIRIGRLEHGLCCHRAGKFKYFADRLGISCNLLRGIFKTSFHEEPHAWNTVKIDNGDGSSSYYLLDLMQDPQTLTESEDPVAKWYKRQGTVLGHTAHGGFGSLQYRFQSEWDRYLYGDGDDDDDE